MVFVNLLSAYVNTLSRYTYFFGGLAYYVSGTIVCAGVDVDLL